MPLPSTLQAQVPENLCPRKAEEGKSCQMGTEGPEALRDLDSWTREPRRTLRSVGNRVNSQKIEIAVPCRSRGVVRKGKEQEKEEEVGTKGRAIPALEAVSASLVMCPVQKRLLFSSMFPV